MQDVRIIEIPSCKMVSSKCGMFGETELETFDAWFSSLPRPMYPRDFLWFDNERGGFVWYYVYSQDLNVPSEFEIIDFSGGLYAVATEVDGEDSTDVIGKIKSFIMDMECFIEDDSRVYLGNIPTPPFVFEKMGYNQMDYFVPIKIKE